MLQLNGKHGKMMLFHVENFVYVHSAQILFRRRQFSACVDIYPHNTLYCPTARFSKIGIGTLIPQQAWNMMA